MLALGALALTERESLASSLVSYSGFEEVAPAIWVDPRMVDADRRSMLLLLAAGKARVAKVYGSYRAQPVVIVGSDMTRLAPFTRNRFACTHYFLGGASVVVGPAGQNIDVVSHELAHAELFERIGWWQMLSNMPTWFDEGLAMQFDERADYSEAQYEALVASGHLTRLESIATGGTFFSANAKEHYVQVKHDVAERLKRVGPRAVLELVEQVSEGRRFHDL